MQFTLKQTIHTSNTFLFDLTKDYSLRKHWDSLMHSAEWLTPESIGKGSQVKYTTYTGMSMVVEYRGYHRPKIAAIEMISDDFWLSQFGGGWRFNRLDEHNTEVIFTYGFKAKRCKKIVEPLFERIFAWENKRRLKKLKIFAEKRYGNNES